MIAAVANMASLFVTVPMRKQAATSCGSPTWAAQGLRRLGACGRLAAGLTAVNASARSLHDCIGLTLSDVFIFNDPGGCRGLKLVISSQAKARNVLHVREQTLLALLGAGLWVVDPGQCLEVHPLVCCEICAQGAAEDARVNIPVSRC